MKNQQYVYVSRRPSSRWGGCYDYSRSDVNEYEDEREVYATWSEAYDGGRRGNPPVGYDWEAVTVEEADHVWPAIDGRERDCGFAAANRLAAERGDEIPSDDEFYQMDEPNEWPRSYAWRVLHEMSEAHAAELLKMRETEEA